MRAALMLMIALVPACGGFDQPLVDQANVPGPALVGHIDAGLRKPGDRPIELSVEVDGESHTVLAAPDGSFVIKGLPIGQTHIEVSLDGKQMGIDIAKLHVGELITLQMEVNAAEMHVEQMLRHQDLLAYHIPITRRTGVELLESDAIFYLEPGDYPGGITVRGHRVSIFSDNNDEPCSERGRASFRGDILVLGNDVDIHDVNTRGLVRIGGKNVMAHSPCDNIWTSDTTPRPIEDPVGNDLGPSIIF